MRSALLAAAAVVIVSTPAHAQFTNPDFETGTLAGWTPFVRPNGTNGTDLPDVFSFDVNGDGALSNAARFNVGKTTGSVASGGGMSQVISLTPGAYTLAVDVAVFDEVGFNVDGGTLRLYVNGTEVDAFIRPVARPLHRLHRA